jgi:hypothetical protein
MLPDSEEPAVVPVQKPKQPVAAVKKPASVVDRYQTPASQAAKPVEPEKPKVDWAEVLKNVGKGTKVKHKIFGEGEIIGLVSNNKYIKVRFGKQEKTFQFPESFINGFLTLV